MTKIPFVDLAAQRRRLGERLDRAIARVMEHGSFILGPEVVELEKRLAAYCAARHVVTCANGTDALGLALMARAAGPGQAVFVPSFTFAATAEAVAWVGATALFVDVRPETFNIDPANLERGIATARRLGLKPSCVIAVDLFGLPADYDALDAICRTHGLWLLADAAQSFGGVYKDRKVGSLAEISTTSFFPSKPLACYGDGGAVFTDSDAHAAMLRSLRVHGQGMDKYDNVRVGMNARLDTLQAAILIEKLALFDDELAARRRIAARYNKGLADVAEVPTSPPNTVSAWALYTLRIPGGRRDGVAARLQAGGVPTAIYYRKPLHLQPAYRDCPVTEGGLAVSERLAGDVLSLPMHPYLSEADQDRIVGIVRESLTPRARSA